MPKEFFDKDPRGNKQVSESGVNLLAIAAGTGVTAFGFAKGDELRQHEIFQGDAHPTEQDVVILLGIAMLIIGGKGLWDN